MTLNNNEEFKTYLKTILQNKLLINHKDEKYLIDPQVISNIYTYLDKYAKNIIILARNGDSIINVLNAFTINFQNYLIYHLQQNDQFLMSNYNLEIEDQINEILANINFINNQLI